MANLINLRDHPHNLCRTSTLVSHARERLGIYRCKHGYTAVLPDLDDDGTAWAMEQLFDTEQDARTALEHAASDGAFIARQEWMKG